MYQSLTRILLVSLLLLASGCATLGWYGQAVRGQLELLANRTDVERLLADPMLPEDRRAKLELALDVRDFASRSLALPDNDSYRSYVELDRDAVLWNVIAVPALSLAPKAWCYPFVGCLAYRGWFRREAAERAAKRLADDGYDVRVSPVAAYSTLGTFDDPLTTPMLAWDRERLAGLIIHELAHQRLFVAGDTAFSEAYATAVERAGLDRWLAARGDTAGRQRVAERRQRAEAFTALLLTARDDLATVYASRRSNEAKRLAKAARFEQLRAEILAFAERPGARAYAGWARIELNNADLALRATYEQGTRAFGALLAEYDGDFARFHAAAEALADRGPEARDAFLNSCRTTACP
ncbi:aminopeptidase [Wenzhouxiangella sp. XN79A]|uniref:aminopeptidase n=1 Tax=Wenzhouxiangella sp. XN79A TaxID=2724193 RepID=UPI00144A7C4A|nr:aminopeptidase [Wenzhouxiangella sp. XN79A]NKI34275.1 aminopeptidase [Wenzhouxiangella sp. XN79A]